MLLKKPERLTIGTIYSRYVRQFMPLVSAILGLSFLAKLVSLVLPRYLGAIVDLALAGDGEAIRRAVFMIGVLFLASSLISILETYLSNLVLNRMDLKIKSNLFAKMLRLSARAMEKKRVGELISRLEGDASAVGQLFVNTLMSVIISLMTVLISGSYILRISPQMTAIAFTAFLGTTLSFSFFGRRLATCQRQMRLRSDVYMSKLQESFAALTEIRALGAADWFQRSIGGEMHHLFGLRMHAGNIGMWSGLTSSAVSMVAELSITAVACWLIMQGRITVGTYVSFGIYLRQFSGSLQQIASTNLGLQQALVSLNRLVELDELEVDRSFQFRIADGCSDSALSLRSVSFSYDDSTPVLRQVDALFPPKSITALVGSSGSGKSTLLKLVVGLYDAEGDILLGRPSKESRVSDARQRVAYVQQEPFLFNMTVYENMRLAAPDATDAEIRIACARANADAFIQRLPDKYETTLGERGSRLSGGERQRLAIARGLLRGADVLLLDEVTSNLDGEAEAALVNELTRLAEEMTVVVVSHRLSTIICVPRIMVLDQGGISCIGNHQELIESCAAYRQLFLQQWNEYLRQADESAARNLEAQGKVAGD